MAKDVNNYEGTALYFSKAINEIAGFNNPSKIKVLDFGCGRGNLNKCLTKIGYDVYGCDVNSFWNNESDINSTNTNKFHIIEKDPYRLPFEDNNFDVVISTSVLEHAQNTEELLFEIKRILKPGGYTMHIYPGKWYLPSEPHIYVPFVNYFWPKCPRWWLLLWAFLGIRNEFQQDMEWKEVADINYEYCNQGLCYISNKRYRQLSKGIFGNYSAPMDFYIKNSHGNTSRLLRKIPLKKLTGFLTGEFRMNFIVMEKDI